MKGQDGNGLHPRVASPSLFLPEGAQSTCWWSWSSARHFGKKLLWVMKAGSDKCLFKFSRCVWALKPPKLFGCLRKSIGPNKPDWFIWFALLGDDQCILYSARQTIRVHACSSWTWDSYELQICSAQGKYVVDLHVSASKFQHSVQGRILGDINAFSEIQKKPTDLGRGFDESS